MLLFTKTTATTFGPRVLEDSLNDSIKKEQSNKNYKNYKIEKTVWTLNSLS
jgi:hypothetical protein